MNIKSAYKNIEKSNTSTIQEVNDIDIPQSQRDITGGMSWEQWTGMFTKEPGDKVYSFHDFEVILKSIHPNLCMKYNDILGFAHFIYFDMSTDNIPIFVPICEVGKSCDNEIPPESGFIAPTEDSLIKETKQDYAGWKQAFVEIKIKFQMYGIRSKWDSGNIDAVMEMQKGI